MPRAYYTWRDKDYGNRMFSPAETEFSRWLDDYADSHELDRKQEFLSGYFKHSLGLLLTAITHQTADEQYEIKAMLIKLDAWKNAPIIDYFKSLGKKYFTEPQKRKRH